MTINEMDYEVSDSTVKVVYECSKIIADANHRPMPNETDVRTVLESLCYMQVALRDM